MSKSRNLHILALLCNLAVIVFGIIGICMAEAGFVGSLKYFTFITALVSCLVSTIASIFHIKSIVDNKDSCPKVIYTLRFIAATMALITFIVVVAYLLPTAKDEAARIRLITDDGLFLHILLPAVSVACFILFEIEPKFRFRNCFLPFATVGAYGIGIIISVVAIYYISGLVAAKEFAPYTFFKIMPDMDNNYVTNIIICLVVLVASFVVAVLVWCLNRIVSSIVVGYEVPVVASKENKPIETAKKTASKKTKTPEITARYDSSRVYHVSVYDRKLKNWKVKGELATRANKVFRTQQEAIDFATELARRCGGSVRVHSRLGRIRKG